MQLVREEDVGELGFRVQTGLEVAQKPVLPPEWGQQNEKGAAEMHPFPTTGWEDGRMGGWEDGRMGGWGDGGRSLLTAWLPTCA